MISHRKTHFSNQNTQDSTQRMMHTFTQSPHPESSHAVNYSLLIRSCILLTYLMNLALYAYAESPEYLYFHTIPGHDNNGTTNFRFVSFTSPVGQGEANSLGMRVEGSLENQPCNVTLGSNPNLGWKLLKEWLSYPAAKLDLGGTSGNQSSRLNSTIDCLIKMIETDRLSEKNIAAIVGYTGLGVVGLVSILTIAYCSIKHRDKLKSYLPGVNAHSDNEHRPLVSQTESVASNCFNSVKGLITKIGRWKHNKNHHDDMPLEQRQEDNKPPI